MPTLLPNAKLFVFLTALMGSIAVKMKKRSDVKSGQFYFMILLVLFIFDMHSFGSVFAEVSTLCSFVFDAFIFGLFYAKLRL